MAFIYREDDSGVAGSRAGPPLARAGRSPGGRYRPRWGLLFALAANAALWTIIIGVAVKLAARL